MGDSVFNVEKAQHALATAMLVSDPALYLQITGHDQSWLATQLNDPTKSIAENDWDGDGISNIDELLVFHTDPRDPNSAPTVDQIRQALSEGKCSLTTRANFFWLLGCTCGQNGCPGTNCSGAQDPTHCACQSGSGSGSGGGPGGVGGGSPPTGCACSQPGCDCNTNGSGQVCGGNTLCHQCSCQFVGDGCTCTNDTTCAGHCVPCPCPGVGAGCQCADKNGCDGTGNMCFQRPCACPAVGSGCMCTSVFGCDGNGSCQVGDPTADFTQVSPNSGFDGVSSPHWLMVPQYGQNSAVCTVTGGNSQAVNFQPVAGSNDNLWIDPTNSPSSPTTITAGSSTVGNASTINAVASDGNTVGSLNVDILPLRNVDIMVHYVTQHDPDQSTVSDIPPMNAPPPNLLENYLNAVYGPQANLKFRVYPFYDAENYDLNGDGILTIPVSDYVTTPEEDVLLDVLLTDPIEAELYVYGNDTVLEIFFVHDFDTMWTSINQKTHRAVGLANYNLGVAFVRDAAANICNTAAHEVGHLLNLSHPDQETLMDDKTPNPAWLKSVPDPHPENRLMVKKNTTNPDPRLLIKPEWDILHPPAP